jgi:superfamily II DNA or RNA helicase
MSKLKPCTIKLIDEVNVAVIGLHPEEHELLSDRFSEYAKNYVFNPKYKLKKWDGKIRFYSKNGATYYNLLKEIVPEIKRMGYTIKYVDKRAPHMVDIPRIDDTYFEDWGITLGAHQVGAVNAISKHGNGMIIAGTGAGKTILTAALCDLYERVCGLRIVVIVPNTDLIDQTALELRGFDLNVGTYSGSGKSLEENIIVSTWQSIQNNPMIMSQFQAVLVDECHGVTGKVLQDILNIHGAHIPVRIGMTGTLPKDPCDRLALRVCLGDVLFEIGAAELIEKGWLAGLSIKMYCLMENLAEKWAEFQRDYPEEAATMTEVEYVKGFLPDYEAETTYLKKQRIRTTFIADFVEGLRVQEKGNTFILVKSVPYGKNLAKYIENAVFVYGADKVAVRKKIYQMFEENDNIVVISTFQLASTGLNIKRIFNLVFVDAGKSFTKIIQAIGRGLRKAKDKDFVNVYDFYSNLTYSKRHAGTRKSFYKEQKYNHTVKKIDYEAYYRD